MPSVISTLRSLRYFDRLIIRGKRMVVGRDHRDPCHYTGHEAVLGFLTAYCNDPDVREDFFVWTSRGVQDLEHVKSCEHCLARVFSMPDSQLGALGQQAMAV